MSANQRSVQHCSSHVIYTLQVYTGSDPVTETQTDTEMIDISKTHTETNTEKIFQYWYYIHIEMIA